MKYAIDSLLYILYLFENEKLSLFSSPLFLFFFNKVKTYKLRVIIAKFNTAAKLTQRI
jgi:hypothetical protein